MRKFHRVSGRRRLFLRSLAVSLVAKERIETTVSRAKEIRPFIERLVTVGKRGRVADLHLLLRALPKREAMKIFHDIAPRYKDRRGGYLRITKVAGARKRDAAKRAVVEFV